MVTLFKFLNSNPVKRKQHPQEAVAFRRATRNPERQDLKVCEEGAAEYHCNSGVSQRQGAFRCPLRQLDIRTYLRLGFKLASSGPLKIIVGNI